MKAKLVVVQGADAAEIPLRLPTVIGRSRQAGVKVRTSVVSREHCQLFDKNGNIFVHDLESANGTFVNDVKIDKPTLLGRSLREFETFMTNREQEQTVD